MEFKLVNKIACLKDEWSKLDSKSTDIYRKISLVEAERDKLCTGFSSANDQLISNYLYNKITLEIFLRVRKLNDLHSSLDEDASKFNDAENVIKGQISTLMGELYDSYKNKEK